MQHVYIIDPQAMQHTLRAEEDITGTNSNDMIHDQSLFRPSGQKVQRGRYYFSKRIIILWVCR